MHSYKDGAYLCRMNLRINRDALGITASLACAIHCAVLPLVLSSLPVFGVNIIDNLAFEYFMILVALCIGCYSLWHGYRKHHQSTAPLFLFALGISLLVAKQVWHSYQLWLLPFAVLLIIASHLMNYRFCRVHHKSHASNCEH